MRNTTFILILLILYIPFGCIRTNSRSNLQDNIDTITTETSYWVKPMDGSVWDSIARDSIKYIWVNDTTDFGLPLPIDSYAMCSKRYRKPQPNITIDMIMGTWYGYGHLYDPIEIMTLKNDGTFTLQIKPVIEVCNNVRYGEAQLISSGKFCYKEERNELIFKDFYSEKDLNRGDYIKYKNPHDKVSIVFSLEQDTLTLYENIGDCFYYYRTMF